MDHSAHHHEHEHEADVLRDPVCNMVVAVDGPHQFVHEGQVHRFCSARCKDKFAADPQRFNRFSLGSSRCQAFSLFRFQSGCFLCSGSFRRSQDPNGRSQQAVRQEGRSERCGERQEVRQALGQTGWQAGAKSDSTGTETRRPPGCGSSAVVSAAGRS